MTRPSPPVEGNRVRLVAPDTVAPGDFLDAVNASRDLHHPWVSPPADRWAFAAYARRMAAADQFGFIVRHLADDALVGVININNVVFRAFQSGYLGYYAFVPTAGRGLMGEALDLVIGHAFDYIGLHRLEANIQPDNNASIGLVRSRGFRLEGFSPDYLFIDGAWRDHERWAITNKA